jgi:hypothetical protein
VKKIKNISFGVLLSSLLLVFGGWGKNGHRIISYNSVDHFPKEISFLADWREYLSERSSDPDNRKSGDPTEAKKHFIDIENFKEFTAKGKLNYNYDSTISLYGASFLDEQGILPWTTIITCDSLKNCFKRKDWTRAEFYANDLGHYVGDGHMPLHITENYNGQLTGQKGVHSRYETQMINYSLTEFTPTTDTVIYIKDIQPYVFNYIYKNHTYADSILLYDKKASSEAGTTTGDVYLKELWKYSGSLTKRLFNQASLSMASLIYTCWCDAGKPLPYISAVKNSTTSVKGFELTQNYPNPFNPNTIINYIVPVESNVIIKLFDATGREMSVLVNENKQPGKYSYIFEISKTHMASGIYFYQMICKYGAASYSSVKKMIVLK